MRLLRGKAATITQVYYTSLHCFFFFSSRRRHTRFDCDWSSDVCSSDLTRLFNPAQVASVTLEIGGGTQRSLIGIARREASAKKLFHNRSPWEILLGTAQDSTPRYEKYSHAERADIYRLHLSSEMAASVLKQILDAAPRGLRKRFAALQPPAAILFFIPHANSTSPARR